jgi:hypothetical protein
MYCLDVQACKAVYIMPILTGPYSMLNDSHKNPYITAPPHRAHKLKMLAKQGMEVCMFVWKPARYSTSTPCGCCMDVAQGVHNPTNKRMRAVENMFFSTSPVLNPM